MNWKMNQNSLFATLLRSPWWMSFAIAGVLGAFAIAMLPEKFRFAGSIAGLPFLVIGCIAAWRQFRSPSAARIDRTVAAVRAMSWVDFSRAIEAAFKRQGYEISAIAGSAANFEIKKEGRTALVSCKRWKVAQTGAEALQDLHAMKQARDVHSCVYVTAGELTDNARVFAAKQGIELIRGPELARLLPYEGRRRKGT